MGGFQHFENRNFDGLIMLIDVFPKFKANIFSHFHIVHVKLALLDFIA